MPPSRDELIRRLKGRGTGESNINARIKNADTEMAQKDCYDHQVVNDEVANAVTKIMGIIDAAS